MNSPREKQCESFLERELSFDETLLLVRRKYPGREVGVKGENRVKIICISYFDFHQYHIN